MSSFLFDIGDRNRVIAYRDKVTPSFITRIFSSVLYAISYHFIPESTTPTVLTSLGTILAIKAYATMVEYHHVYPKTATNIAAFLLFVSCIFDSVDGIHGERCRSHTVLDKLTKKLNSSIRHVFMSLTLFVGLGIADAAVQWYLLMAAQLTHLAHLFWSIDEAEQHRWLSGAVARRLYWWIKTGASLFRTTEASIVQIGVILAHRHLRPGLVATLPSAAALARGLFAGVLGATLLLLLACRFPPGLRKRPVARCASSPAPSAPPPSCSPTCSPRTRSASQSTAPCSPSSPSRSPSPPSRAAAATPSSPAIIVASLGSNVAAVFAALAYCAAAIAELAYCTGIPLLAPVRNVYIDGVFDLCHRGHKLHMERALAHGNRLIVGIMSDEQATLYKRRPVMTLEERCDEVFSCTWVSEVIPAAEMPITAEMIERHNIHVVCHGAEYDHPDDTWYTVPRSMGITKTTPRTSGISTSVLIKRIQLAYHNELCEAEQATNPL